MTWTRWLRRHLWARPGRTAISVVAVVTGVGVFVGVALGTQAVVDEIRTSQSRSGMERIVELEPIGFAAAVDRADLDRIDGLPGVTGLAGPHTQVGDEEPEVQIVGDGFGMAPFVVFLDDGVDRDLWMSTHAGDLGPLRIAEFDTFRDDSIEFFESIESALVPLSAASLVVSGFIIYVTMSRTVGDRRTTFGTMRAVGATPSTVVRSVLAEAAVIGAIGTAFGIGLGHVLGPSLGRAMSSGFGIPVSSTVTTLGVADLALACVGGLLVPPVAAGVPAWRAARVQPATAMGAQRDDAAVPVWRGVVGIAAFVLGTIAAFALPSATKAIGAFVAMVGLFGGVPLMVSPLAGALRVVMLRARPGISDIAVAQVVRRRGRTAVTVGLVTGTLALVAMVQTVIVSQRPAFVGAVETTYGADAEVSIGGVDAESIADSLAASDAVEMSTPLWRGRVDVHGERTSSENLTIVDPETFFEVSGLVWTSGTDGSAAIDALEAGGATVVSTNVAETTGVSTGDMLAVRGVGGDVDLLVAGTYYGFAYGTADAVVVSIDDGRGLFRAADPGSYLVDVTDAASSLLADPGLQLLDVLELPDLDSWMAFDVADSTTTSDYGFSYGVYPLQTIRTQIIEQFDGIFGLVQVLAVMVAVLGLLGLTNTLSMEVLDRRQEFGVLRALGLQRRQVVALVVVEGAVLAVLAALLALGVGTVLGWAMADSGAGSIDQLDIPPRFPVSGAVGLVVAATVVGAGMSVFPGRAASRVSPTELLRAGD